MKTLTIFTLLIALTLPLAVWAQCGSCPSNEAHNGGAQNASFAAKNTVPAVQLAGYNKVNMIDETHYFTYAFAKKPKLGMATLIVKVYGKDKKLSKGFDVYANSDMPSMKGAHATGDVKLKPNKKGELLVPVNFVMPGVWQVDLKFQKAGKQVFDGYFTLKI